MLEGEQTEADPEDVDTVLKTQIREEMVPDNLSPKCTGDSFPEGEKNLSDDEFAVDGNVLDSDLVPDIDDRDVLSLIGASAVECGSFEESFMNKLEERLNELENQDEAAENKDVAADTEETSEIAAVAGEDCKKETTEPVIPGSAFVGSILKRALQQRSKTPPKENKLSPRANFEGKVKEKLSKSRDQALMSTNIKQKTTKQLHLLKKAEDAETAEERQIRTGEMTPFGTVIERTEKPPSESFLGFQRYLNSQNALSEHARKTQKTKSKPDSGASTLRTYEFPSKKKSLVTRKDPLKVDVLFPKKKRKSEALGSTSSRLVDNVRPGKVASEVASISLYEEDSDFQPPSEASDDDWSPEATKDKTRATRKRKLAGKGKTYREPGTDDSFSENEEEEIRKSSKRLKKEVDDGDPDFFKKRVQEWKANEVRFSGEFHSLPGGFRLPKHIWDSLFDYQKVGVSWFWELHQKNCGGILGDEMGLGKTIQVITFLAGVSCSNMLWRFNNFRGLGPTLIVCPATVMHQWVKEFHTWWPPFRCVILHESGSHTGSKNSLIRSVGEKGGILITSYVGLVNSQSELLKYSWHYVILDEGHKIRNPDAQITLAVKQIPTPHRIILSGSPLQNNLKELWSLFDFVFPGKLGTLPTFMEQFAVPITQGGYANASDIQVAAAFKCATVLRDIISPYLLRRMKSDVKHHVSLPPKSEQVLFCKLTDEQKACYINYLQSKEIDSIVQGRYNLFVGLINLRKICNHPHLFNGGPRSLVSLKKLKDRIPQVKAARGKTSATETYNPYKSLKAEVSDKEDGETSDSDLEFGADDSFGDWKKSGKMIVLETLLKLWKKQNHKVLLFSQSRQMLCILESFVRQQGYTYLRLDGGTTIGARQPLIQKFNEDPSIFVFILTTKVGGLGVNLTGANRVIIFDPDWNPSTDLQARERAWRIGQDRQVTIYRLITSGTIEEKIYHRQIFKQFLTNRVLKNPKQKRFFKASDVIELFSFNEGHEKGNESQAIFAGTGSSVKVESRKRKRCHSSKSDDVPVSEADGFAESTNHEAIEPREKSSGKFKGVPHLVKQKSQKHDPAAEKAEDTDEKQDEYVLKKLFRKSGVHAALKHDKILETNESDYLLVEKEAERVAADAVKVLKKSREQCWAAETGRVTFTGSSGTLRTEPARKKLRLGGSKPATVTKPPKLPEETSEQSFFSGPKKLDNDSETLSSAELVAAIRARKRPLLPDPEDENPSNSNQQASGENPGPSNNRSSNENLDHVKAEHIEMLREIREYIAFRAQVDGQASTKELVTEFGTKLPPQESPLFKQMLNQLCTFRRVDGQGIWKLKPEFR